MSDFDGAARTDDDTAAAAKQTARDKAGEGVGLTGEKTSEVTDTTRERAGQVAGEAAAKARDVTAELRGQVEEQARTQTQRLARSVRQLADDMADMGENGRDGSPAAHTVRQVADRGRGVATRLEERGPQGLVSDLQDFARRRPGVFLAGAALAGFATARLAKGAKSAEDGTTSGGRAERPGARGIDGGSPAAITRDREYGADEAPEAAGRLRPTTPSYGGAVSPSGPLPVTDPYPDPDPKPL
ncbi:hypothetical protein [uncultured Streptomyces sp.]|uniref:hypothetical protein n=1 Tax=uncultured Streptomyces sp. TaxID=174707 RepID=UPI002630A213|nr:hypothetical protein [uncultured Streptomyces sp.]